MNKFSKVFVSTGLAVATVFTVGAAGNGHSVDAASNTVIWIAKLLNLILLITMDM